MAKEAVRPVFALLVIVWLGVAHVHCKVFAPPKWPASYTVKGLLQLPYAEIKEPFTAWYNAKANKSRIDYYGDMLVTIQIAGRNSSDFGKNFKVSPMSTEKALNVKTCFLVNGTKDGPVTTQSVLPDLSDFKLLGKTKHQGKKCQQWQLVTWEGDKKNTYTMFISDDKNQTPVRYEMFGYDSLLGSHYDKYYLDYEGYKVQDIPDKIFNPPTNLTCKGFPGPGAEGSIMMNPMKEYVNRDDTHIHEMFDHFKRMHNKKYRGHEDERERKHLFRSNVRYIHSKNRAALGFTLAVNHLADYTDKELKMLRGRRASSKSFNGGLPFNKKNYPNDIPDQIDWRLYGAVTPVKDQAVCGSCWSFGTTGAVEGAYFHKTQKLVRLSQQELMDCSWGFGNNGCDGGEDFRAYQWIMKHGIATEAAYGPYLAVNGYCHYPNVTARVNIKGYINVTSGDQQALKIALAREGPISVAIDAAIKSFVFYAHGVFYDPKCGNTPDDLDHAVLAVGYGTLYGQPYWLVKNSWSTYWGNAGYILISQKDNNCGVATDPTFVIIGN